MPKDPVCGQEVREGNAKTVYKKRTYCFCCASCQFVFEKDPEKFAKAGKDK